MFDGAAGAPLRRTRSERQERARAQDARMERARQKSLRRATDLTAAGDLMQSAGSRVLAGIQRVGADRALGYEDSLALSELRSAIDQWTEARRA